MPASQNVASAVPGPVSKLVSFCEAAAIAQTPGSDAVQSPATPLKSRVARGQVMASVSAR